MTHDCAAWHRYNVPDAYRVSMEPGLAWRHLSPVQQQALMMLAESGRLQRGYQGFYGPNKFALVATNSLHVLAEYGALCFEGGSDDWREKTAIITLRGQSMAASALSPIEIAKLPGLKPTAAGCPKPQFLPGSSEAAMPSNVTDGDEGDIWPKGEPFPLTADEALWLLKGYTVFPQGGMTLHTYHRLLGHIELLEGGLRLSR